VRAVALDDAGLPALVDLPEPNGDGHLVRVRACGLCGSDVEKLGRAPAGTVLGHEVVGEVDGRRVALVHHLPCGECARCLAGHESTCERFRAPTIEPGGFAEWVSAREVVDLPPGLDDATATFAEPLACALRGAERLPHGRVLVIGGGFVGRLFERVLRRRGDEVFVHDVRADRDGPRADGPVVAAVVCAPGGTDDAAALVEPGGTVLVFAPAGRIDLDAVYRRELRLVGSRSATPRHLREAVALLPALEPLPVLVLPLERFHEGLDAYRARRALKVVFVL
jgi:L-iditol 2-dehydrogenase